MVRLITYDNVVEDALNSIFREKSNHCGLVVGQCTDQKDIVVRLCPTPVKDEDFEVNSGGGGDAGNLNQPKSSIVELDEQWISQHAKQLMRALPGGLDILGFYVAAPSDYTTKHLTQLRQILFAVFDKLSKNKSFNLYSNERILLTICPVTAKIVSKTYNIMDYKSSANPADWKLLSVPMRWQRVRCIFDVNIKFPIKSEDAGLSLQKQIEIGLRSFLENVQEAHALVNGVERDLDELLDPTLDVRRSKKKSQNGNAEATPLNWINIDIFLPLENNNNVSNSEECDCTCMLEFEKSVHCRAYVHSKATVREAIWALKLDIIRSITARCEIHCEDLLLIEDEQEDPFVENELPRRVFAPLPQENLCVCDYQFHYNMAVDSLEAFKELLNLHLSENDIDTTCERLQSTNDFLVPDIQENRSYELRSRSSESRNTSESSFRILYIIAVVAMIIFAFIGILVPFLSK